MAGLTDAHRAYLGAYAAETMAARELAEAVRRLAAQGLSLSPVSAEVGAYALAFDAAERARRTWLAEGANGGEP